MNLVLKQQMDQLKDDAHEKEMKGKLNQLKDGLDKQKKDAEKDLQRKQKEMEEARRKLEEELKKRDEDLKNKMKQAGDQKQKLSDFEEKYRKEKEDAERLRKLQEEKEKLFEEEKRRALMAFEEAQKQREKEEFDQRLREKLEQQLSAMIQMWNDANEMCRILGRNQYFYKAATEIQILPDGTKVPKVVCKAYPDRKKDFHNVMNFDEFEDKLFMMKEKYDQYMYEVEEEGNISPELEIDENEGFIFGLSIRDDWHLIGNWYIFLYSLAAMLEIRKDHSPIIDIKGEQKGSLCYSIEPIVYDENGEQVDWVESIYNMLGRDITVEVQVHYASGIPEKWSTNVFTEYKWVDVDSKMYETEKSGDKKNKNPVWEYRHHHHVYVSNDFIDRINETALVMSVYGKLSPDEIENLYEEFALNPTTNALLVNKMEAEIAEDSKMDITNPKLNSKSIKIMEGDSKEVIELKKKLEEMRNNQMKLKKQKIELQKGGTGSKQGCCCWNIF